jgi:hypothetical protein
VVVYYYKRRQRRPPRPRIWWPAKENIVVSKQSSSLSISPNIMGRNINRDLAFKDTPIMRRINTVHCTLEGIGLKSQL